MASSSLALFLCAAEAAARPYDVKVRVIRASNAAQSIDPKLADLAKELSPLKFSALSLADEALFKIELGSSGRMQLPGKEWMTISAQSLAPDGKLRLSIEVDKLQLKAVVAVDAGATVAVRGPEDEGATLILAVTRAAAISE